MGGFFVDWRTQNHGPHDRGGAVAERTQWVMKRGKGPMSKGFPASESEGGNPIANCGHRFESY